MWKIQIISGEYWENDNENVYQSSVHWKMSSLQYLYSQGEFLMDQVFNFKS